MHKSQSFEGLVAPPGNLQLMPTIAIGMGERASRVAGFAKCFASPLVAFAAYPELAMPLVSEGVMVLCMSPLLLFHLNECPDNVDTLTKRREIYSDIVRNGKVTTSATESDNYLTNYFTTLSTRNITIPT